MTKKEEQAQNCYCYYQNGGKEKVKRHYEITKNLYLENSLQSIQRIIERIRKKKGNRVQKKLLLQYNWRIQSNTKRYNKEKDYLKNKLQTFGSMKRI